jgi:hypothetical protein
MEELGGFGAGVGAKGGALTSSAAGTREAGTAVSDVPSDVGGTAGNGATVRSRAMNHVSPAALKTTAATRLRSTRDRTEVIRPGDVLVRSARA